MAWSPGLAAILPPCPGGRGTPPGSSRDGRVRRVIPGRGPAPVACPPRPGPLPAAALPASHHVSRRDREGECRMPGRAAYDAPHDSGQRHLAASRASHRAVSLDRTADEQGTSPRRSCGSDNGGGGFKMCRGDLYVLGGSAGCSPPRPHHVTAVTGTFSALSRSRGTPAASIGPRSVPPSGERPAIAATAEACDTGAGGCATRSGQPRTVSGRFNTR